MHNLITPEGIDQAYQAVLGRPADEGGRAHFQAVTKPYQLTVGRLMHILAQSEEFRSRPADEQRIALETIAKAAHPAEAVHWFHSITLPDGYVTNGMQKQEAVDAVFRHPVKGRSVLDIGAWDGFYSFGAEQRGAADVLSTDWFCWGGPGWGTKAGFDFAKSALKSRVRECEADLFSLDPAIHGTFDTVLFLGVLYHLVDPLGGLRKAAAMSRDHIIVLTHTWNNEIDKPLMEYAFNLNGDDTTFWYQNIACVKAMLSDLGFKRFDILDAPPGPENGQPRHVIHARRN
ncbi:class I SAM-dependent methyltransferase [Rhodopseudomonas telluris]|uniref:Class I SAM-dependent methyltransferase n=1 Tax=Rhodopseudomonas telluris TaxID=644215 RepID=A0ABV6EZK0_9BRAD